MIVVIGIGKKHVKHKLSIELSVMLFHFTGILLMVEHNDQLHAVSEEACQQ